MAELWDVYDQCAKKTGRTIERGKQIANGDYHLVVHIWVVNSKGEILIQKRASTVTWRPGMWAATGGSAVIGEDEYTAAIRELNEEIGINMENSVDLSMEFLLKLKRHDSLCSVWVVFGDVEIDKLKLQKEEVDDVAWVSRETLQSMMEEKKFYSYDYLNMLLRFIDDHEKNS